MGGGVGQRNVYLETSLCGADLFVSLLKKESGVSKLFCGKIYLFCLYDAVLDSR